MNLINQIDNYLIKKEKSRPRERHYPSDVNACMRQLYWKWTDQPKTNPIDASGLWKMNMGNAIHDLIYEFLEDAEFDIIAEVGGVVEIPELKYPISYRVDYMFIEKDTGNEAIIEAKTSYGRGIKAIQISEKPKEQDLAQVVLYIYLTKIKKCYFLYVGRDNSYRTQFVAEEMNGQIYVDGVLSEVTATLLIQRLMVLEEYLAGDVLPDRDYMAAIKNGEIKDKFQKNNKQYKTDWQCSYCQWKDRCWEEELEECSMSDNSHMFMED